MRPMNYKKIFLFIIGFDLLIFAVIGAAMIPGLRVAPQAPIGPVLVGAVVAMLLSIGLPLLVLRPLLRQQSIAEKGQPAAATLLEYWDTGTTINDDPLVGMLLEVRPLGGSPYQSKLKTVIPRLSINMLKPGAHLIAVQV